MHQSQKSRSLETRPQFQTKNSTVVLNEYYHKRFKEGMQNISKLSRLHDKVSLNHTEQSIDEREELSWEEYSKERQKKEQQKAEKDKKKKQPKKENIVKKMPSPRKTLKEELREQVGYSRKKQHSKEPQTKVQAPITKQQPVFIAPFVSERFPSQPPEVLFRTNAQEERKSSNKSSSNNKESEVKQSSLSRQSKPTFKESDMKPMSSASFSLIKLRKVESEYHDRSDTMSNAGNPLVSEIIKNNDFQLDDGRQKSIYSLALQTHKYKRKKSPEGREKKNFKKAFLQKKYNTSHLSQIHHKIEKQNELYVRNIKKVGAVNFSSVIHMRKAERQAAEEARQELKAFEYMKQTIYRQISQPVSDLEAEQQSVQALMALRRTKPQYEDTTSAIQNIQIKEYDIEQSVISEEQATAPHNQQSLAHYQAIYEAFEDRSRGSKEQMSSSFSRYYTTQRKTQQLQNEAIQEKSHEESFHSQQPEQPPLQLDEQRYNKIIGDQIFGFVKHIDFQDNTFFQNSLQRLITLTEKIKYNSKQAMASTKQKVLLIIEDLLEERLNAKEKYMELKKQQSQYRQLLKEHLDSRGNIIERREDDKYMEEVSRALADRVHPGQSPQRSIVVNKVIIKKLIEKSCQLFTENVLSEV